jgi:hypothetical protein
MKVREIVFKLIDDFAPLVAMCEYGKISSKEFQAERLKILDQALKEFEPLLCEGKPLKLYIPNPKQRRVS